jgi:hypothetical protein
VYHYAQPEPNETPLTLQVRGARIAEELLAKQIEATLTRAIELIDSVRKARKS